MSKISEVIERRNLEVEEEIAEQLRRMSRYERRKAFKRSHLLGGAQEGSLSQKRGRK